MANLLFNELDLYRVLQANISKSVEAVNGINEDRFKGASDVDLIEHVYTQYEVEALELLEDRKVVEIQESNVDVRYDNSRMVYDKSMPCMVHSTKVIVTVPYTGERELWKCQPSTFSLNPPRAEVQSNSNGGGTVNIVVESPSDSVGDGQAINRDIENTISNIRSYLENIWKDVAAHNQNLRLSISSSVANRRQRLGKHADLIQVLNIPLKRKGGAPEISPLPINRKLVKPLPNKPNLPPESGIRQEDYEHILSVIRHEGRSFESTPETFAKFGEEELRDVILAHLNGHYEGDATGETFRKLGKTDIRIEDSNRAAFVAECKMWRGQGEVGEAIDQLLGYLTWRDCKAALVMFNKNVAGFTSIQESLRQAISGHQLFESSLACAHAGEWRFRFHSSEDIDHKVELHVFLFNLYVAKAKKVRKV